MLGTDASNLLSAGHHATDQEQKNLDLEHNDFLNQFNFPAGNNSLASSLLQGSPYSNSSTQTSRRRKQHVGQLLG